MKDDRQKGFLTGEALVIGGAGGVNWQASAVPVKGPIPVASVKRFVLHSCSVGCPLFRRMCLHVARAVPAAAVNIGSLAYRALDSADIAIVMDRDVAGDQLRPDRRSGRRGSRQSGTGTHDPGYNVYGHERMSTSPGQSAHLDESEHDRFLASARKLGVQAIVTGNVAGNQVGTSGIPGSRRTSTVVQSPSLRMIDVARQKSHTHLHRLSYRAGSASCSKRSSSFIKAKLDDPDADISELINLRGGFHVKDPGGSDI